MAELTKTASFSQFQLSIKECLFYYIDDILCTLVYLKILLCMYMCDGIVIILFIAKGLTFKDCFRHC